MPAQDMPAAEVTVDEVLVRRLLSEQHPDLADRDLELVANGWDNAIVRIGADLCARLPRRAVAVPLVEHEQRWLPHLAPGLPLPIPAPVRVGGPGTGYPWPWSICPWFDGRAAIEAPPSDGAAAADVLGRFLRALHAPAPADAPANPYRGIPLPDRAEITEAAIDELEEHRLSATVPTQELRSRWRELAATPPWHGPPVWLHGDLHPGNLLVHDGALSAVIDFGDLTAGDPACDLAVAWMLLAPPHRAELRVAYGDVDEATWARARGWALALGVAVAARSADNPTYAAHARRTIEAALADDP